MRVESGNVRMRDGEVKMRCEDGWRWRVESE